MTEEEEAKKRFHLFLMIRLFGLAQSPDSKWAAKVKRYTVSRIDLKLFDLLH